jgi:hypothetical protein
MQNLNFPSFKIWGSHSVVTKSSTFWDMTRCSPISPAAFRQTTLLHIPEERTIQTWDYQFLFFLLALQPLWAVCQFSDIFTAGRTPWTGHQLVSRPLPKHRTAKTQKNTYTHQTSMLYVGFEPTITASERAKTVHALDRSATVAGQQSLWLCYKPSTPKI